MSENSNTPPRGVQVFRLPGDTTVTIAPAEGYIEPQTGFVRTNLSGAAPTAVNMVRALLGHASAVLDEIEALSEREFVDLCDAYVPLVKKVCALPARVAWRSGGAAVEEPGG